MQELLARQASERSRWAALYRIGAIAALLMVALMVAQMVAFMMVPPPSFEPTRASALDWFALFESRPMLAIVHLDGGLLVDYVFVVLLYLALSVALFRVRPVAALIAAVLSAVAATTYFSSNPAFTMLALSNEYRSASGELARSELLAAAQTALAVYHGTPFDVAYVLSGVAGLIVSGAMFGSGVFGRPTAYIGLVAAGVGLVPATAGTLGFILSIASLPPLAVWLVLIARRLWWLGR